jgi:hypothetical protein
MTERHVNFIKGKAEKLEIAESDMLRRIIDQYMEEQEKKDK